MEGDGCVKLFTQSDYLTIEIIHCKIFGRGSLVHSPWLFVCYLFIPPKPPSLESMSLRRTARVYTKQS